MLSLAALLLLYMSAPTPAAALDDVDPIVARLATGLQAEVGRRTPGDMVITAVRGEGRALIMDVDLPPDVPELIGPAQLASLTAATICSSGGGAAFFRDGRVLRLNAVRAGRAIGSSAVNSCPGPVGPASPAGTAAYRMRTFVGMEADGVRIVSVRAEGNSVIVTVDVASGAIAAAAAPNVVAGVCLRPEMQTAFFDQGLTLRVDVTVGGSDYRAGTPITSCPARPPIAVAHDDVDPLVAEAARRSHMSDTTAIRHVTFRGEGRTLVVAGEIAPDWAAPVLPGDFAPVIANSICAGPGGAAFFTEGRTLRVELRRAGGASTSATVDRCSMPAGADPSTVAGMAGMMQSIVGKGEDGVAITSIHADGETLVVVFDGPAGWRQGNAKEELDRVLLNYFCNPAVPVSPFFDGTRGIRVDTLEGGRAPIQGRRVSGCPGR